MGIEIQIDSLEDLCKLMCDNELPEKEEESKKEEEK